MEKEKNKNLEVIANWLYKAKRRFVNDEILLFHQKNTFSSFSISKFLDTLSIKNQIIKRGNISEKFEFSSIYLVNDIDYSFIKEKINFNETNLILFSSDPNVVTSYMDCKRKFIFFDYPNDDTIDYLSFLDEKKLEYYSTIDISEKDRLNIYLEKQDPLFLINSDHKIFHEYLFFKLFNLKQPFSKFLDFIIKDTKYERYLGNETLLNKMILFETTLLKERNILTATLAMLVYRITTLDLKADKTNIGNYYRKKLGTESKNLYNLNKLLENFDSKDIIEFLKQAKVYDLNKSKIILSNEDRLKIRIAKKLFLENELNLTSNQIQEITEISSTLIDLYVKN
jgi:hypothetical protein